MVTIQEWLDRLCETMVRDHETRMHEADLFPALRDMAERSGLLKPVGSGWYELTRYGQEWGEALLDEVHAHED